MFCMRFTSSRAIPSLRRFSVTVMSSATVTVPSVATSHPGISSLRISTSATSMVTGVPSTLIASEPSFSSAMISAWLSAAIAAATAFIILPCFGPSFLKSALMHFTSTPSSLPTNLISLTLTSERMSCDISAICCLAFSLETGIMSVCSGWRTFMFTLRRNESTSDVMVWARFIFCSRSLSIRLSSAIGYDAI